MGRVTMRSRFRLPAPIRVRDLALGHPDSVMFRHEGANRSHHHNQLLAGYLAMIAGFVNSAGFILIGSFTSHVTGNVGRFGIASWILTPHADRGSTSRPGGRFTCGDATIAQHACLHPPLREILRIRRPRSRSSSRCRSIICASPASMACSCT